MAPPTFTVFTATYNRAHTLGRVYHSLQAQTLRDFEWLIVDDGSTDGTAALVAGWRAQAEFPIRILYQPNAGKAAAFNRGVQEARGELFLNLDSDDACIHTALERLLHHWEAIPAPQRESFTGVTSLCVDQRGLIQGPLFPHTILDSDSLEVAFRYRDEGERWGFHRTEVLRAFPFPVDRESRFVSESVVWFAIARHYKTRFVNEPLRLYFRPDGAGDHLSELSPGAARGRLPYHLMVLNELLEWLPVAPQEFLRSALAYSRYSFCLGTGLRQQLGQIQARSMKVLIVLVSPVGWLYGRRDRRRFS
ncbi:glycosyltransferase family A protein [Deinococcus koreensis]|uniref:glycosyltransferase family A protein n=1 Tax=Deinococcus koreensis TaxID=2054903 RepID=UPI0013FDA034|nr:glycosyltransferase family A protein [Deinococcus koreensis]